MNWYTLRVISGKEKKVKDSILFEIKNAELDEYVENILVPTENVLEMRDGKKKIKEKVFFPGYLLINIDMNKETKYVVFNLTFHLIRRSTLSQKYIFRLFFQTQIYVRNL